MEEKHYWDLIVLDEETHEYMAAATVLATEDMAAEALEDLAGQFPNLVTWAVEAHGQSSVLPGPWAGALRGLGWEAHGIDD